MKTRIHIFLALLLTSHVTSIFSQSYYALDFIENKGQWEGDFNYKTTAGDGSLFIGPDGYTIVKHHPDDHATALEFMHGHSIEKIKPPVKITTGVKDGEGNNNARRLSIRSHAYTVRFIGAKRQVQFIPEKPTGEMSNYFLGGNPENWKTDVGSFATVIAKDVYPGVDVKYYSNGDQLKYDLVVQPGADLSRISMRYDGVDKISIRDGQLIIETSVGQSKELAPYAYQIVNGEKVEVSCSYALTNGQVNFKVRGYDKSSILVIDPVLVFSTYTGSKASNWGFTAAPGPDGSLYAGGIVFGTGYPISIGAFQTDFLGGTASNNGSGIDVGITRFSNDGKARLFSTYLGGNGNEFPHSIFVDPIGNPVILGRTTSLRDFPVLGQNRIGALGETDIFVTKLSADGRTMLGGVVVGGSGNDGVNIDENMSPEGPRSLLYNYGDNARSEVILDNSNNVYVASSSSSSNFPAGNNPAGQQDGVVMKFSPDLSTPLFITMIGGALDDAAFVIALNPLANELYVAGATASSIFPGEKTGTIGEEYAGSIDGFVSVIDNNGDIKKSTFLGTNKLDIIYGIQFDEKGFPYVMGISLGDWVVQKAEAQPSIFNNQGARQFISKLLPDLSGYVYSTVFGKSAAVPNISPVAFLVDRCENVYVSGWGGRLNLCYSSAFDAKTTGTAGLPLAGTPIQNYTDNKDFYFFVLKKDGTEQLYGSFFGQQGGEGDHVDGGTSRFDNKGAIYQAICANCGGSSICRTDPITKPMIITPGVVARLNGALGSRTPGECNLAAFKINFEFDGVKAGVKSIVDGISYDTSGCVPLEVEFVDTIGLGKQYIFVYGDGTPNDTLTTAKSSHIFTQPNLYSVMVIAIDESRCITRDTSYVNIKVSTNKAIITANAQKQLPCDGLLFKFVNESIAPLGSPFTGQSFVWDFGHDGQVDTVGLQDVYHSFPAYGSYKVKLFLIDDNYCNQSDFLEFNVFVSPLVKAQFISPEIGCIPYTAEFINTSTAGTDFQWSFGDGSPVFNGFRPPAHSYGSAVGDYNVMLIATDSGTCNIKDTFQYTISVKPNPVASFSFRPDPPQENTPLEFTNQSSGATTYLWNFGDGFYATNKDTSHLYQETGTYNVCLTAYNEFGCADTTCDVIETLIFPLVDLPNAFTPNGDGNNDVLYVRGFGIKSMALRIYNRLGQLVFESSSPNYGWDGKFKGVLQPMDAYAYTLNILFGDDTTVNKKGDITLIR
jgi:gliding motility-associated-like protein